MSGNLRVAVFGAGAFGRNHARVLSRIPGVELAAIVDLDLEKAREVAAPYRTAAVSSLDELPEQIQAAIVATPTVTHETVVEALLGSGVDVLVEKPIADSTEAGVRLTRLAEENGAILQVGHLERFNPAVTKLRELVTVPLFFEVHRLSVFTPRSLDVDVVMDLMIHDLDIVLQVMGELPMEVRAAGISVLSPKVDIANVRLAFSGGCVANLTASRVSTEQIRKLRLFQPGEYLAIDYKRQDLNRLRVSPGDLSTATGKPAEAKPASIPQIGFESIEIQKAEPLELELRSFLEAVRRRSRPAVDGWSAVQALELADKILVTIEEHASVVSKTIRRSSSLK